jgi:hypothetical protein
VFIHIGGHGDLASVTTVRNHDTTFGPYSLDFRHPLV